MTSSTFSAPRFGKYFITDLKHSFLTSATTLTVIAAVPMILSLFLGVIGLIFKGEWVSPTISSRIPAFIAACLVILISQPAKFYGRLTDKRFGTAWSLLPASALEKTLSMILICCIVTPVALFVCYGSVDALVCLLDKGCGDPIFNFSFLSTLAVKFGELPTGFSDSFKACTNPWLYVDDIIQIPLTFLLGALIFKKNKTSKTLLVLILSSIVFSCITSAILRPYAFHIGPDNVDEFLSHFEWIFNHIVLWDTINDTVFNLAFIVAIYFRVKTIKH